MLLAQVAGVLLILGVLTWLVRKRLSPPSHQAFAIAAVCLSALLATVIAVVSFGAQISGTVNDARRDGLLPRAQAAVAGSAAAGARADFLSWVTRRLPANASFYLIDHPEVSLWATYQLSPRRSVTLIADAQWLVLYGAPVAAAGSRRRLFGPELLYAPGFGIARRR